MINRGRIYFLYLLLFCSCRCPQGFYVDNGKNWKKDGKFERYTSIEDQDFVISVHKYNEEITINYLTKFNAPALVKERGVKITFNQAILRLDNKTELVKRERESINVYTDSTLKHRVKDEYYTSENFSKEIKKNKELYFTLVYAIDSSGAIRTIQKTYVLFKKRYCYFAVH